MAVHGGRRLVGRREEIDLVRAILTAPGRRAVVVGGQAGVGKTRLAQHLAERWTEEGRTVEWVSGTVGARTIPFGAVARLLEDVPPAPDGLAARDSEVIKASVRAAAAHPDRLVVVDDGHSLDEHSALLVQHLVLAGACPVLVTVRNGEEAPTALAAIWQDQHAERVDLQPLSEPEAAELAAAVLGGDVDPPTASALFAASDGNPLLLDVIVRDALETGALRDSDDGWRADGTISPGRHLREVLRRRMHTLGEPGMRLLGVLAVAEPLSPQLLRRLAPHVDLDEAEARGLVRVRAARARIEVLLGHPLLGEVVRADVERAWLDGIRLQVADAIAAVGSRRSTDLLLEARLRVDAAAATDPELLLAAASRMLHFGDVAAASTFIDAAIEAGAPPIARVMRAESFMFARRERDALDAFEAAVEDIDEEDPLVRAAASLQHLVVAHDDSPRVERLIERIEAKVDDPIWKAVIQGNSIQRQMMSGSTAEASRRAEALLAANDDPRVLLRLVSSVGSGRALAGRTQESRALVDHMLPVALQHSSTLPLGPTWVMNAQAIALLLGGHIDEGLGFVELLRSIIGGTGGGVGSEDAWLDLFEGRMLLSAGRIAEGLPKLERAAGIFGDDDLGGFGRWCTYLLAEQRALLGDLDGARDAVADADGRSSRAGIYDGDALRARAWVTALGGQLQQAIDDLVHVADLQHLEAQRSLELNTLHDAVRLGAVGQVGARLLAVAEQVDGRWPEPMAAHVRGLQAGSGSDLEDAGEAFVAAGAWLMAAECLAEAVRAFEAAGLKGRVAGAMRRRDELIARCGSVRTPALQDLQARVGLTRREREVVELAAQGLSNKEIADRLFVSLRTAEGHLYRAFAKLGVDDRSELAAVLGNA